MRMQFSICIMSLLLWCAASAQETMPARKYLTPGHLKERIAALAHDSLEGRGPGTRGEQRTISYLVSQFKSIGLEPAGERGTFVQNVPIIGLRIDPSAVMIIQKGPKQMPLKFPDDFVATTGVYEPTVSVNQAELVFVGYGIVAPEFGWDDYKGVDVKGKVLLMMNDDPAPADPKIFGGKGRTYYGRWTYKYEIAAKKGAVGAIIIHTDASAGYPYKVVQTSRSQENVDLESPEHQFDIKLKGWTTEAATRRYLAMALSGHGGV
jgi:hypothetical protein